jgi:hypothetical protein
VGTDACGNSLTVNQLMDYANALLSSNINYGPCATFNGQNGSNTTGASALRTEQVRVKDILDKINNGGFFGSGGCLVAYP